MLSGLDAGTAQQILEDSHEIAHIQSGPQQY